MDVLGAQKLPHFHGWANMRLTKDVSESASQPGNQIAARNRAATYMLEMMFFFGLLEF